MKLKEITKKTKHTFRNQNELKEFIYSLDPPLREIALNKYANKIIHLYKKSKLSKEKKENGSKIKKATSDKFSIKKVNFQISNSNYIGNKSNDIKEGFGIQKWQEGEIYIGYFHLNRANGIGLFKHPEGDQYLGDFLNDKLHGYGIYTHKNGATYEGMWKSETQDGIGIEIWTDGSIFEGEYCEGKKEGYGKYIWIDGASYEGMWKENNLDGWGIYTFNDERIYKGEWKDNMMEGFGEFYWKDGKKYIGEYRKDKKEGFGIYAWEESKRLFLGFWKDGKQEGPGMYVIESKIKFGIWSNGKRVKWFNDENEIFSFFDNYQNEFARFFKMNFKEINSVVQKFKRDEDILQ